MVVGAALQQWKLASLHESVCCGMFTWLVLHPKLQRPWQPFDEPDSAKPGLSAWRSIGEDEKWHRVRSELESELQRRSTAAYADALKGVRRIAHVIVRHPA